jgi:pSer/pThr/pTyr-binding forkhead associated (FHA) protein
MTPPDEDISEQTIVGRTLNVAIPAALPETGYFLTYAQGSVPKRVRVGPGGLVIGRAAPSDVQIPEPNISRKHCRVEPHGESLLVTDLTSTNGTFLNGKRLEEPTSVPAGSIFCLGSFTIRFERRDLAEIAEEESLTAEIKRAEEYVRAILPPPILSGPVQAEGWFVPSSQLGGDAYGYQFLDPNTFIGFVLDVSGHGIGSAMHAANAANSLRRCTLPNTDFRDPAQVAAALNTALPMEEHNGLMLTLWYFCYDLPSRMLKFCAAGHHAAYLASPEDPDPAPLWLRSPAIGMLPSARWAVGAMEMPAQARLYVFSDGCFEIALADGSYWTQEGLRRVIKQPPEPGVPESQRIFQVVRAAARPGPLDDDFSMLVMTFE